jgi:hypothetical protein
MGLHGGGYRFGKGNKCGSATRSYQCDICGQRGSNRGENRIRHSLEIVDGIWTRIYRCKDCQGTDLPNQSLETDGQKDGHRSA